MAAQSFARARRVCSGGALLRVTASLLIVVAAGPFSPLSADEVPLAKVKSSAAKSAGEAVRLAAELDERIEKLVLLRRRALELDFEAWQALVDGEFDEACDVKAEELREVKAAYGHADPWTRATAWGAESFLALRKLSDEQRELVHQAARADRMGQRLRANGSGDRALSQMRRAVTGYADVLGVGNQITINGLHRLAEIETEQQDFKSAHLHRDEMLETIRQKLDEKNPFFAWASGQMAILEEKMNESHEAEARWKQIVVALEPLMVDQPQQFIAGLFALAHQHLAQLANDRGEFAEAEDHARNAVQTAAAECALFPSPETRAMVAMSEIEMAVSAAGQGRVAEASRAFDSVLRFMYSNPNEKPSVAIQKRVLSKYAEHCRRTRRTEDAKKLDAILARFQSDDKSPPARSPMRTASGEVKTKK